MIRPGMLQLFTGVLVLLTCACGINEVTSIPKGFPKATYCYPGSQNLALGLSALYDSSGGLLPDSEVNSDQVAWTVMTAASHRFYNGIGRYGGCTGTLLDTSESESAPAYIITNAHCVEGGLQTNTGYITSQAASATSKMYFHYYVGSSTSSLEIVSNKEVTFASMDDTDAAIVELNTSLSELKAKGICPFKIAASKPSAGEAIQNIGVPQTGVSNLGLRISQCIVGETVHIREGSYTFSQSFKHRCSIVGGNSGSPVVSTSTFEIVGLVNTTVNDSAENNTDCTLNKPCEVASDGSVSTNTQDNYGQTVAFLAGCFDTNGVFSANESSCGITAKFRLSKLPPDRQ